MVLLLAACGKTDDGTKRGGPPPPACDVAKMTQSWAYDQYAKTRDAATFSRTVQTYRELGEGVYVFSATDKDGASQQLGLYWRCTRYEDPDVLLHDVLLARGWASASPAQRVELALAADKLLGGGFDTPPENWDPHKAFSAPTAAPAADGGVKLRYWTEVQAGGGGVTAAIWNYELHEQPIDTDATVHAPSKIDGYQINTRGYPDPRRD